MLKTTPLFSAAKSSKPAGKSDLRLDNYDALDEAMIAGLSATQISEMTRDELIRVIERTCLPVATERHNLHVVCADRQTLVRLAFLARRCCRNQGY